MLQPNGGIIRLTLKRLSDSVTGHQQEGWLPPTKRASAAKIN